jgi:hypothetical protein
VKVLMVLVYVMMAALSLSSKWYWASVWVSWSFCCCWNLFINMFYFSSVRPDSEGKWPAWVSMVYKWINGIFNSVEKKKKNEG